MLSFDLVVRWSGLVSMAAGLLLAISGMVGFALNLTAFDPSKSVTNNWVLWGILTLISEMLILLGLIGLYARQTQSAGVLGLIGFLLAFIGQTLQLGASYVITFAIPMIAREAPTLLTGATGLDLSSPLREALLITSVIYSLGWILFALATVSARLLPHWGAWLLIIGIISGFVTILRPLQPLIVGIAFLWLGFALWSSRGESSLTT